MSIAAAAVLTFGVLVALVTLHTWSDQQQQASQSISALRTVIAVEQEGVPGYVGTTQRVQAEAQAALAVVEATETSSATRRTIARLTSVYQSAVSTEMAALRLSNVNAAATTNVALGDPAFTALEAELLTVGDAEASSAASGVTAAFVASIGIVSGAGILVLLFALYARRRRARIAAVESTAAALAHESRVAAAREDTFRSLFDENPQAMMVTALPALTTEDGSLRFLAVNNAALAMYGYSRAEFLTLELSQIRPPEERDLLRNNLHAMRGGRTHFDSIRS